MLITSPAPRPSQYSVGRSPWSLRSLHWEENLGYNQLPSIVQPPSIVRALWEPYSGLAPAAYRRVCRAQPL